MRKNYIIKKIRGGKFKMKRDEFNSLQVGDIIWINRYDTIDEKERIPKGHRTGPAVIIKKNKRATYILPCTSNSKHFDKKTKKKYCLGKKVYGFTKNSYIIMTKIQKIKASHYLYRITTLTEYDLNQIKKILEILNIKAKYSFIKDRDLHYELKKGDIVRFENEEYYIYRTDDKYYYLYKVLRNKNRKIKIVVSDKYYSFDIAKYKKVSKRRCLTIIDTFLPLEIYAFETHINKLLKNIPKDKKILKPQNGDVIKHRNHLYLILKTDKNGLIALKIRKIENRASCKTPKFKIGTSLYTTKFVLVTLNKKEYEYKTTASKRIVKHIEYFISQMPQKIKYIKNALPNMSLDMFAVKNVICNTVNNNCYLITQKNNSIVELVNIKKIYDTFVYEINRENPFQLYKKFEDDEYEEFMSKVNEFKKLASSIAATN